jgi:hypothetical protein
MRTVSFFRGTADVLVDGNGVGVGAFSSWLIGKIDFLGEFPPINGSFDGGCQLFEGKVGRNQWRITDGVSFNPRCGGFPE